MTREERKLIVKVDLLEGRLAVKEHELKAVNNVLDSKIKDLIDLRKKLFKLRGKHNDN